MEKKEIKDSDWLIFLCLMFYALCKFVPRFLIG